MAGDGRECFSAIPSTHTHMSTPHAKRPGSLLSHLSCAISFSCNKLHFFASHFFWRALGPPKNPAKKKIFKKQKTGWKEGGERGYSLRKNKKGWLVGGFGRGLTCCMSYCWVEKRRLHRALTLNRKGCQKKKKKGRELGSLNVSFDWAIIFLSIQFREKKIHRFFLNNHTTTTTQKSSYCIITKKFLTKTTNRNVNLQWGRYAHPRKKEPSLLNWLRRRKSVCLTIVN